MGCERPFERPWMRRYIDLELTVNNSLTCNNLGWSPNPRYLIEARMPFLVERMKSEPYAWQIRNMVAMRRVASRPDFHIYTTLSEAENEIIERIIERIEKLPNLHEYPSLSRKDPSDLLWFYKLIFRLILTSIHTNNKLLIQNYFEISGISRFEAGFSSAELITLLHSFKDIITDYLNQSAKVRVFHHLFYDYVSMPIAFGIDEVEYQYTLFEQRGSTRKSITNIDVSSVAPSARELLEETIWNCLVHRK